MKTTTLMRIILVLLTGAMMWPCGAFSQHVWDGSLAPVVHRIRLVDENEHVIKPVLRDSMPISTRYTCGACHDYEAISKGLHFNSGVAGVESGRPGEPWVWVDDVLGLQLPMSYRDWNGLMTPEAAGLTPWEFTQLFGRHLPGGGVSDPDDVLSDPRARWEVSGTLEINCLGCHNASARQDMSEWAKQMTRENFRWAATAASGIADVGGMASRMKDWWLPYDGPNPDDAIFAVPPTANYDGGQCDAKGRAYLDIAHKPEDGRCLHCHSVTQAHAERWRIDGDVHSRAGMMCVDCHRNGIGHNITRGTEDGALSCEGCHLGDDAGRMGAPVPLHKGMPKVHFEKMTCTSCHVGPALDDGLAQVWTSRANRLGIYGRAQWRTDLPAIVAPVYVRGDDGKIGPRRMLWPAFWGRMEGTDVVPLDAAEIEPFAETLNADQTIASVLDLIAGGLATVNADLMDGDQKMGAPVFALGGSAYGANLDGGLEFLAAAPASFNAQVPAWAMERDGQIVPMVGGLVKLEDEEGYDLSDDDVSVVEELLIALADWDDAPGAPAFIRDALLFSLDVNEYLAKSDAPDGAGSLPEWGWQKDGAIVPLVGATIVERFVQTVDDEAIFTEGQVADVLKALGAADGGEYVYVARGKLFRLNGAGALDAAEHVVAQAYSWPYGHDVLPASQSLGKACTDCHTADSDFFFTAVTPTGPLKTDKATRKAMHEFQDLDADYHKLFGLSFKYRPAFKATMMTLSGLLALVLLAYATAGIRYLGRRAVRR